MSSSLLLIYFRLRNSEEQKRKYADICSGAIDRFRTSIRKYLVREKFNNENVLSAAAAATASIIIVFIEFVINVAESP